MNRMKAEIEENLKGYFDKSYSYNKKIYEAQSYSLNVGGKRIRPILMLLTYSLYKNNYSSIMAMAMAIEIGRAHV